MVIFQFVMWPFQQAGYSAGAPLFLGADPAYIVSCALDGGGKTMTHMLHGAGIYANMTGVY